WTIAPSGPAPAMVGKEMSLSSPVSRRKLSSAATASISVSLPRGASRSNQARKRVTAAPSRRGAGRAPAISGAVLTAFIRAMGEGRARDLAAVAGDEARGRVRRSRLIEPHGLLLSAERCERVHEIGRLAHIGEGLQAVANVVRELSSVDIERRPSRLRNDGEGE